MIYVSCGWSSSTGITRRHILQKFLNISACFGITVSKVNTIVKMMQETLERLCVNEHYVPYTDIAVKNIALPSCPITYVDELRM